MNIDIAERMVRESEGVSLKRLALRLPILEDALTWACTKADWLPATIEPDPEDERVYKVRYELESIVRRVRQSCKHPERLIPRRPITCPHTLRTGVKA